ncbi:hypothetical protein [Micavibrio aeruginosavorus]|uniref:Uncharacterized protein n=1 Tax=Micavibrio aeruginosavorus (strain ARL-13) TaxID=856793 RepID=G2KR39_MICAA|nr:hypothetical protein [Micavibrio aeruginosavorus]AEP08691.1 hypothetical protein MICA_346 [Micavibrio aeruginosavorus ARL-13]
MVLKTLWPFGAASNVQTPALELPTPDVSENQSGARYGRRFRTQAFVNPHMPEGDEEYYKAIAKGPNDWRVIKYTKKSGDVQTLVMDESVSFVTAAQKLVSYETAAEDMGLLPLGNGPEEFGFEHVTQFCLREGFVPDRGGRLHETENGEIVTEGRFDGAVTAQLEDIVNSVRSGQLFLRDVWVNNFIHDLFNGRAEPLRWVDFSERLKDTDVLHKAVFLIRAAMIAERRVVKNGGNEGVWKADHFINETKFLNSAFSEGYVQNALKSTTPLTEDLLNRAVDFLKKDGSTLPEDIGKEAQRLVTDLQVFQITRRVRSMMRVGAQYMDGTVRDDVGTLVGKAKDLMHGMGYDAAMIADAESSMLCTEPVREFPKTFEDRVASFEDLYKTSIDILNKKLSPQIDGLEKSPPTRPSRPPLGVGPR